MTAGSNGFGYDLEGRLSSGYGSSYTFDYEHRLTSIGSGNQFYYDGAGHRLVATRNGVTTFYIYDASGNLLAEADSSGQITRYYIYGAGLLAMVTPEGEVYNYHYNAVGSTVAITDQSQNMVNKYAYDPFGEVLNQVEAIPQQFKFVGQFGVMAEPSGFYYMRARYYDPKVGRFISEDPIGLSAGSVNIYQYVGSNPVNYNDPLGLYQCTYNVSAHSMICVPDQLIFPVFESSNFVSGNNNGLGPVIPNNTQNNPAASNIPYHGPIPQGDYTIGAQRGNSSRRDLVPDPQNNMYGRSGFQTHGCGNPATCSEGCIAATTNATRDQFNQYLSYEEGNNGLRVKP